jgi:dihydroxy-acid dehydratase
LPRSDGHASTGDGTRRSAPWLERRDLEGFGYRAALLGMGRSEESFRSRPIVGVCNTWSEVVHCNVHLRALAAHVRRGVEQAGGLALEFPVISLGEPTMKPTTMLFRNLMAMDVEESIRAYPFDAVVLLVGCDKTIPAAVMGALSADVPAVVVPGGPQLNSRFRGQSVGSCTDCWLTEQSVRAGASTEEALEELEHEIVRSPGHCSTMGTASTMACLLEALGLALPASAAIPAADSRRSVSAELTGRLAVELARADRRPSHVVTRASFENAVRVLHALGGSTNAVIHLLAYARRIGVELALDEIGALGRGVPLLANVKPSGEFLMEDFYFAGGLPALMYEIRDLLHLDAASVTGKTIGETLVAGTRDELVIRRRADVSESAGGAIGILRGNICPRGAVVKTSAASPQLMHHRGPAVVFDGVEDLASRIDDPSLDIDERSVLVLRNMGPVGAPGMPECGHLPIPRRLLAQGVTDMVRISDARMSGTGFGTCVLHVAPEAAVGGPLAAIRDGDDIELDVLSGTLNVLLDEGELERRLEGWSQSAITPTRGYSRLYVEHVLQADEGCDFDFLASAEAAA